jgi:hypothetical protein
MKNIGGRSVAQVILGVLFVLYLIMDYPTPLLVASFVNSIVGKVIVLVIFLSLFFFSHPILGILGLFVAFELIRRASSQRGGAGLFSGSSSPFSGSSTDTSDRASFFSASNQFPYTLEEEVVKNMTPNVTGMDIAPEASYLPLLDNTHDASKI